jgi:hypothetical protein
VRSFVEVKKTVAVLNATFARVLSGNFPANKLIGAKPMDHCAG